MHILFPALVCSAQILGDVMGGAGTNQKQPESRRNSLLAGARGGLKPTCLNWALHFEGSCAGRSSVAIAGVSAFSRAMGQTECLYFRPMGPPLGPMVPKWMPPKTLAVASHPHQLFLGAILRQSVPLTLTSVATAGGRGWLPWECSTLGPTSLLGQPSWELPLGVPLGGAQQQIQRCLVGLYIYIYIQTNINRRKHGMP